MAKIPFNRPYMAGGELENIRKAHDAGMLAGDGMFTRSCQAWLEQTTGCHRALLTHSCTAALEMASLLVDIGPGDEVIMPSYTFVSTANAFVLRGATPVFVDIREDTLNLDENLIAAAVSERTRAIVPVHYAGVGCAMAEILALAREKNLVVIEDAAQGVMASQDGQALGTFGDLGALSFHETKNLISGEGGALLINREDLVERAEILWEKGTNRSQFFRGQVDKYTWVDVGSSFLPGELVAAFLRAQMDQAEKITAERLKLWQDYHDGFAALEQAGLVRRPVIPANCNQNAHMYYLLVEDEAVRTALLDELARQEIMAVFHYVPLHSSPAGRRYGQAPQPLPVTEDLSRRLLRLPLWVGLNETRRVIAAVCAFFQR